jgi:hypothetical protein
MKKILHAITLILISVIVLFPNILNGFIFIVVLSFSDLSRYLSEYPTPNILPYGNYSNGSVNKDNREWLRCALGQTWTGSNCVGDAQELSFQQAQEVVKTFNDIGGYNGKKDWRIPSVEELANLRVCSTGFVSETNANEYVYSAKRCNHKGNYPTLDTVIFPKTPIALFCTDTIVNSPLFSAYAWYINFYNGNVSIEDVDNQNCYVRLIRSV